MVHLVATRGLEHDAIVNSIAADYMGPDNVQNEVM